MRTAAGAVRGTGRPVELDGDLRAALRQETEMTFAQSCAKTAACWSCIDSDYTFLNERLAKHYGLQNIPDVPGITRRRNAPRRRCPGQPARRRAHPGLRAGRHLEPDAHLAGEARLVHPRKHPRHAAAAAAAGHPESWRNRRKRSKVASRRCARRSRSHRSQPLCSSCHNRMDPLGLALENFNALGMWREKERGQPIDATGKLITRREVPRTSAT